MAGKKKKLSGKRMPAAARRKFSTPSQTRAQLEGITAAQLRYRRARRKQANIEGGATETTVEGIMIDSREKSEQAWKNALRAVRRPEDLDGFD